VHPARFGKFAAQSIATAHLPFRSLFFVATLNYHFR
jgi:hypothetical protein